MTRFCVTPDTGLPATCMNFKYVDPLDLSPGMVIDVTRIKDRPSQQYTVLSARAISLSYSHPDLIETSEITVMADVEIIKGDGSIAHITFSKDIDGNFEKIRVIQEEES